jgi:uncharacterized protein Yka (UPF0111/DUF47 family)
MLGKVIELKLISEKEKCFRELQSIKQNVDLFLESFTDYLPRTS